MAEKPPAFVVTDKRKFTLDGDLRDGEPAPPEREAPPAAEPAAPTAKVVTMPARAPEPEPMEELPVSEILDGRAGFDVDGDGPESEADLDDPLIAEPRSPQEIAAQQFAYQQSARDMDVLLAQANPGMEKPGPVGFEHIVQSFYLSAIMAMGAGTQPGQKPRIDILGARQAIDMLTVLEDKTKGNLSEDERRLLEGITFELRMMFLEITNSISKQAHAAGPLPPGPGLR